MTPLRTITLTGVAMLAFAANSLLCRLALQQASIDPASFASVRLASGALMLAIIVRWRLQPGAPTAVRPDWLAAAMLWAYVACFSFAYLTLAAGTYLLRGVPESFSLQVKAPQHRGEAILLERTTAHDFALRPAYLRGLVADWSRALEARDFAQAGSYVDLALPFVYSSRGNTCQAPGAEDGLEFRTWFLGGQDLALEEGFRRLAVESAQAVIDRLERDLYRARYR